MARERKGFIVNRKGRLYARVGYTDEKGTRRDIVRRAENRTHARELIRDALRELDDRGARTLNASRMTFADLAAYFEEHYLKPAEYVDGRKVDGVRSLESAQSAVNVLKAYFERHRLQTIRYSDLRKFRADRLKEPTPADIARHRREIEKNSKAELRVTRKIATVNRELAKLRRMLNIALREGWIKQNPFNAGETLISLADERPRERILTREEERRFLDACMVTSRAHLRPLLQEGFSGASFVFGVTVNRLLHNGALSCVRVGRSVRFRESDLTLYLSRNEQPAWDYQ